METQCARPQINARLMAATEKPTFSTSFHSRHRYILVGGYYERRPIGMHKLHRVTLNTGARFAMVGHLRARTKHI
jgi:putative SOS response-associated peptidase YedK